MRETPQKSPRREDGQQQIPSGHVIPPIPGLAFGHVRFASKDERHIHRDGQKGYIPMLTHPSHSHAGIKGGFHTVKKKEEGKKKEVRIVDGCC